MVVSVVNRAAKEPVNPSKRCIDRVNDLIEKLVIRIVQNGSENHIPICVTRATKMMYLIEWDYFAWNRNRLTSLDWIYLHYGPWSSMLSDILREKFDAPPEEERVDEFRQVFWRPPQYKDIDTRLHSPDLEGIVRRVFEVFGSVRTQDIVKYIYFNTEPMQHAERGQTLDFTPTRKPLKPFNPVTTLNKNLRQIVRERLRAATKVKLAEVSKVMGDVPLEVLKVLSQLDSPKDFVLPEGIIQISDEDKRRIAEEG